MIDQNHPIEGNIDQTKSGEPDLHVDELSSRVEQFSGNIGTAKAGASPENIHGGRFATPVVVDINSYGESISHGFFGNGESTQREVRCPVETKAVRRDFTVVRRHRHLEGNVYRSHRETAVAVAHYPSAGLSARGFRQAHIAAIASATNGFGFSVTVDIGSGRSVARVEVISHSIGRGMGQVDDINHSRIGGDGNSAPVGQDDPVGSSSIRQSQRAGDVGSRFGPGDIAESGSAGGLFFPLIGEARSIKRYHIEQGRVTGDDTLAEWCPRDPWLEEISYGSGDIHIIHKLVRVQAAGASAKSKTARRDGLEANVSFIENGAAVVNQIQRSCGIDANQHVHKICPGSEVCNRDYPGGVNLGSTPKNSEGRGLASVVINVKAHAQASPGSFFAKGSLWQIIREAKAASICRGGRSAADAHFEVGSEAVHHLPPVQVTDNHGALQTIGCFGELQTAGIADSTGSFHNTCVG